MLERRWIIKNERDVLLYSLEVKRETELNIVTWYKEYT